MSTAPKRPTQNDVARLAGVSRGTVSYVVNGLADGKVAISPETRARVWEAVETLGYVPDAGARALRSGETKTIGLLLLDLHNPHFWENADGVEQEVRAAGYRMLLSSMDLDPAYGEEAIKDLSSRRIDALIFMDALMDQSPAAQEVLAHCFKRRLPIVELSYRMPDRHPVDSVVADYYSAAEEAMAYLIELGHRRIAFVNGSRFPIWAYDRTDPYRRHLAAAGLVQDPALLVHCGPTIEDGYRATQQLLALPDPPTAILAINDLLAMGVLRAAADCGLHVPADLSVMGFDDIPAARYLVPRLTTASKDPVLMGREAAKLAIARLNDPDLPHTVLRLPTRFVVRESTGPAKRA